MLLAIFLLAVHSLSQAEQQAQLREFPISLGAVQSALQQLGAYRGARLPSLAGFIEGEPAETPNYEHPYYEFKFDLKPLGPNQTLVSVQVNVSAWYADPQGNNSGYQKFKSNGRLESDILDRLSDFLSNRKSISSLDLRGLEQQIEVIHKQRVDSEHRIAELERQLLDLKTSGRETSKIEYVTTTKSHVPVLSAPGNRASLLLHAELEDEFEILQHRGAWSQIRLEGDRNGWIRSSQLKPSQLDSSGGLERGPGSSSAPGFTVVREIVSSFSGDWPRLKDKPALYIWARPEGSALNVLAGDKLKFAKHIFVERYREAAHNSQNSVQGIVVIFLDQRGGVAAADLDNIRSWAEGGVSAATFIAKCSLDPPGAFGNPTAIGRVTSP